MADIVQFETGQPVEVALKFSEPKVYDGQFGERAMYSLTDGRIMYVDPLTAAKIKSLGVQTGEFFYVLKSKKGRSVEWSVFREGQEPPLAIAPRPTPKRRPPAHVLADRLPELVAARNLSNNLEGKLAESIAAVAERKPPASAPAAEAPKPRERWAEVLLTQTSTVIDVYAAALEHASRTYGNAVKPEDIRAIMTTVFINLTKHQGANRAA